VSREFIEGKVGNNELSEARRQQAQILHFTKSIIQPLEFSTDYLQEWATRKFATNDPFLAWVSRLFDSDNFMEFFQYVRYPLPSAKLVNNSISTDLKRVFFSEDAYFRYSINGEAVEEPEQNGNSLYKITSLSPLCLLNLDLF